MTITKQPRAIRSFSQALAALEAAHIPVVARGRIERFGSLMWEVEGRLLDKEAVIRRAQALVEDQGKEGEA